MQQRLLAMAILTIAAGLEGWPFADDLDDIADTIGQWLGHGTNTKRWRRETAARILGEDVADWVLRGISAGIPLDLSLRLGVGNLLPGTSLAKRSEANRGRETAEVFGPVGGVVEGVGSAISALAKGDTRAAALEAMPVAMANAYKGLEMWTSGVYKDTKGRKITDVSHSDAFIKFLGFNPNTVAVESRQVSTAYDDIALQRIVESSIADKWVRGILEGDQLLIREAHQERLEWNQKNPNLRVVITASQIKRRVKEARLSRQQRFISRVPREMRGNIATQIQ